MLEIFLKGQTSGCPHTRGRPLPTPLPGPHHLSVLWLVLPLLLPARGALPGSAARSEVTGPLQMALGDQLSPSGRPVSKDQSEPFATDMEQCRGDNIKLSKESKLKSRRGVQRRDCPVTWQTTLPWSPSCRKTDEAQAQPCSSLRGLTNEQRHTSNTV